MKAKLTTIDVLKEVVDEWTGPHGRSASRAARLVRDGVDSPMETRIRLLVVLARLPEPRVNLIVRAEDGSWRLRFDLCYEEYKLIVEYDGRQHANSREQWERDIYRREELDRMGYRMVIVTANGIYQEPLRKLERVPDALGECGATGIRSRFKNDWRRHFVAG